MNVNFSGSSRLCDEQKYIMSVYDTRVIEYNVFCLFVVVVVFVCS